MSAALVNEAKMLYRSAKTPYGPFRVEQVTVLSDDRVTLVPLTDRWFIRDVNGKRIATIHGNEETARMFAALPEFLDPDLGAQTVGKGSL